MGLSNVQGPGNRAEKKQGICHSASWMQRGLQKKKRKKTVNIRDMSDWYRRGFHFGSWRLQESYQAWSDLSADRENTARGRCLPVYKLQTVQTCHCQETALLTRLQPLHFFSSSFFNLLKELPQIFVLLVNIHIRWIKSLKKTLEFWATPHRISRHLSKYKERQKEAAPKKMMH